MHFGIPDPMILDFVLQYTNVFVCGRVNATNVKFHDFRFLQHSSRNSNNYKKTTTFWNFSETIRLRVEEKMVTLLNKKVRVRNVPKRPFLGGSGRRDAKICLAD